VEIGDDLLAMQVAAAAGAGAYLAAVLAAQGVSAAPEGSVVASAFADLADGGGSWLRKLAFAVASVAGVEAPELERALWVARSIVLTGIQDVGRSAVQAAMQAEPSVTGYVRMLNAPSCSRCVVLAGRVYGSAVAFRRHLRCDCRHIPQAENADDWTTSPQTYFDLLTAEEQDATFGEANAEAIRLGADISQVVNAEQGVTIVGGIRGQAVTSRSLAGIALQLERGQTAFRPLPDEIFQAAERAGWDRAETLRQLRRFGYVI
jgi:hypothetical protein